MVYFMLPKLLYKGKTQYFSNFTVSKKDGVIVMSGVGADDDMFTHDYKIYTKIIELNHIPRSALFFGGGALVAPRYFLSRYPNCSVSVVEADSEILRLARRYVDTVNISLIHKTARQYIDTQMKNLGLIDLIFLDITMGAMYYPSDNGRVLFSTMLEAQELYVYTKDTFKKLHAALYTEGACIVNHIGTLSGKNAWMWQSSYQILQTLFPYVRIFPQYPSSPNTPQNVVIVCSKGISALSSKRAFAQLILSSSLDSDNKANLRLAFLDKWTTFKKIQHPIIEDRHILSKKWNIIYKTR